LKVILTCPVLCRDKKKLTTGAINLRSIWMMLPIQAAATWMTEIFLSRSRSRLSDSCPAVGPTTRWAWVIIRWPSPITTTDRRLQWTAGQLFRACCRCTKMRTRIKIYHSIAWGNVASRGGGGPWFVSASHNRISCSSYLTTSEISNNNAKHSQIES